MSVELSHKPYPSDVSEEEWALAAPYLALRREEAPQREPNWREVYNALRYLVKCGCPWRSVPTNFPPWGVVYQQAQRWMAAGVFASRAEVLRVLRRLAAAPRQPTPTAAILDRRTLQSTPQSGPRAGYDGAKRRKGSKLHWAVDTLGPLLAWHVTPADEQDRAQVGQLAEAVPQATGHRGQLAYVEQGYTGETAAQAAQQQGIALEVVKLPEAQKGFVLLPRRWVVERSFAWATRFRRLVRDYERLPETVLGRHLVAFVCLMIKQTVMAAIVSP